MWYSASWNVRSLLECDGPVETAGRVLKLEYILEDRRIDLAIRELGRYRVTVGAL